jgi:hypothetical protein
MVGMRIAAIGVLLWAAALVPASAFAAPVPGSDREVFPPPRTYGTLASTGSPFTR